MIADQQEAELVRVFDPHVHFWHRHTNSWLPKAIQFCGADASKVTQAYTPLMHIAEAKGARFSIEGSVHVQADADSEIGETNLVQAYHECFAPMGYRIGIVGFVDLSKGADHVRASLEKQQKCSQFRGIRFMLDHHPTKPERRQTSRGDWMTDEGFLAGMGVLDELGLMFDLQILPCQTDDAVKCLVSRFPNVRFVLNHLGMPYEWTEEYLAGWRAGLAALAEHKNVFCKLSGFAMFHENNWSREQIRPIAMDAIAAFGVDRCMFASNFPVDKTQKTWVETYEAYMDIIAKGGFSAEQSDALLRANALRVYSM
jgi:predicted TIM-barrel fold metal-dependent hydrolase